MSAYLSNHKLYLPDMLCTILAWDMACVELGANTHLQSPDSDKQGYLQTQSDGIPRLASGDFALSWSSRALLILSDYLPTLLSALGLALTGLLSRRLTKGECQSRRGARTLVRIGLLSFLALLFQPFINTLQNLVPFLGLPDGERILSVSIELTSEAAYEFLRAIFLYPFDLTINEVRRLGEEVEAFV